MKILSKAEMEKLPTKRLLAYKTRLLKVRDYCCYCGDPSCPSKVITYIEQTLVLA